MFGHHQDEDTQSDQSDIPADTINRAIGADNPNGPEGEEASQPTVADPDPPSDDQPWQHPGTPIGDDDSKPVDTISPAGGFPQATGSRTSFTAVDDSISADEGAGGSPAPVIDENLIHKLIDIKQHALEELEPLIDSLDQTPEERFRTIMMMIQASDDQDLVEKAYQAAHNIEDEKAKAQALLDIVNEINYFTQQPESQ